jgi:hypothetical protein
MKLSRKVLIVLGILIAIVPVSWAYTSIQLSIAHSKGVFDTPEQGMIAIVDKAYAPDRTVKILYAGPNSTDGSQPYVWYVIAEVRASARADGSELQTNGCDAPGSFFLQTKQGWAAVPEEALPGFMGFWMKIFGMAGKGQSTASTTWVTNQEPDFCQ